MKWTKIIKKIEEQIEAGIYPGASFAYFKDNQWTEFYLGQSDPCLLYTSPSPRDGATSRMPSSA